MSLIDVVGDDDVAVALEGHPPAGSQCGDLVARAVYQQRGVVAVDGLNDPDPLDVRVLPLMGTDDTVVGAVTRQRVADHRLRLCARCAQRKRNRDDAYRE